MIIFATKNKDNMKQVRPKKNLGQHFLTDLSVARRIADTVDSCPELPVLEVGPGMGVLTQFLAEKPRPLAVVEIDAESVAYLKEKYGWEVIANIEHQAEVNGGQMRDVFDGQTRGSAPTGAEPQIIANDFLRMDLRKLFGGGQFVLTGNYPYDISSQIFFKMLDNRDLIPCCTGMIQHEVALRMAAPPGNKQYGILSVLIQAWYDVEYLFTVEPSVFNPPPKVQSAVIRLTRNQTTHLGCDEQLFRRVVKATFGQRRKMLRVSLRQLFDAVHPASSAFFQQDMMTRRPEQLTITEFVELTNMVAEECVR
jgi:16S rRNA (adenine1518-N6/adenine1519-N6)-dimethyltransferase